LNIKNIKGQTPLHIATLHGYTSITDNLIDSKAYLDATDRNAQTALYVASITGRIEMVKKLIEAGSKINTVDVFDKTPKTYAEERGHKTILRYFEKV